jgi:2-(1,2-epoxy-1,2-dihydrophenyl)acetyl-CoA isomerase
MKYQHIRYEMRGTAAWITLDRPSVYNALDIETASELSDAIEAAADDRSVRVAVVTGSGKAFCAGGDVQAFHSHLDEAPDYVSRLVTSVHAALRRIYEMPVPVVAAINGAAAGAGLGLAIATDLAIAGHSATFTVAYTAIGATPDAGTTHRLPQLVGTRRALELAMTNRTLSAMEALEWGLINRVVPDDELEREAGVAADLLAEGATDALVATRQLIRTSLHTPVVEQLDAEAESIISSARTKAFREGVTAFTEKRPASFPPR